MGSSNRPHFSLLTSDLGALASANRTDAAVLDSVARELEHRSSKAAERLRADVQSWLAEVRTDSIGGESGASASPKGKVSPAAVDARADPQYKGATTAGVGSGASRA